MLIEKVYQGTLPENKIMNEKVDSTSDTYSCDYINNLKAFPEEGEEIVVGTWKGKPLYRRVIELPSKKGVEYGTPVEYDLAQYNAERAFLDLTHSQMFFNDRYYLPLSRLLSTTNYISSGLNGVKITIDLGTTFSQATQNNVAFTFVVEYTKTTD